MDINLIICLLVAFVLSLVFIPVIIKLCKKFSIYDQVDERKVHSGNVSRFGGLGVFLSFLIAVLLYFLVFCRGGVGLI